MRLSSLLVAAIAFVCALPSASAFTGYVVSQQATPGQSPATYSGTMTRQYPVGPFASKAAVFGVNDADGLYCSWWQAPIAFPAIPGTGVPGKPFVFPFYGVNYSSISVTSKGFLYMGSYGASDLSSLETAEWAPDYTTTGAGFPTIDGVERPVISFLHSAGGAVSVSSLANAGAPAGCLAGTGACQFSNYFYEIMPPISSYMSVTTTSAGKVPTLITLTPLNSIGTTADGYRFVLVGLQLRDITGVSASVVVILYQSGLIEIFYYTITPGGAPTDDYMQTVPSTGVVTETTNGLGHVSVGLDGGSTGGVFTMGDGTAVSQVSYSQLHAALAGTAVSFKPQ